MVARLTPDQKVACSIHVGFKPPVQTDLHFLPNFPIIPLISAVHPSISTVHIPLKTRLLRYLAIPFSPRSAQPANPEPPPLPALRAIAICHCPPAQLCNHSAIQCKIKPYPSFDPTRCSPTRAHRDHGRSASRRHRAKARAPPPRALWRWRPGASGGARAPRRRRGWTRRLRRQSWCARFCGGRAAARSGWSRYWTGTCGWSAPSTASSSSRSSAAATHGSSVSRSAHESCTHVYYSWSYCGNLSIANLGLET